MSINPNDPIVQLCAQGIQDEMSGNITAATELYNKAWQLKTTDYHACIVAHYMARVQTTNEDMLHWNLLALQHAGDVTEENIEAFYPSLYLNVGKSYEDIGNTIDARKYYELGKEKVNLLPDDPLGNLTKEALTRALERVSK